MQVFLHAEMGSVVYTEGKVTIRDRNGNAHDAELNDPLDKGFTVTTGKDGYAELDKSGSRITLSANTVFQLLETDDNGKTHDVFSAVAGAVSLKIKKITDKDSAPYITSQSTALGVRGTAFSVFSGVDGSSLVAVEEGKVAVEAKGVSVELAADEGIEVQPGNAPGAKFTVLKGKIDFKSWSDKNLTAFLADPVAAAKRVEERMSNFIDKLHATKIEYDKNLDILNKDRETLASIEDKDKKQAYHLATEFPQMLVVNGLLINLRYYSVSSFSLRRFVLGRMYANIKSAYIMKSADPIFTDFSTEYKKVLALFEKEIMPYLVDADF
jgi:hypothetical protein